MPGAGRLQLALADAGVEKMRLKVMSESTAIFATLLVISMYVAAQYSPPFPEHLREHMHLRKYVNQTLAFELLYPSSYQRSQSTLLSPPSYREQWQVLLYATTGSGRAQCEDEGECDKFGEMVVALDQRRFDLRTIEKTYAHTGWDQPVSFQLGGNTFYWYGPGGGGASYPDTFFYDLNGRTLIIEFNGPYRGNSPSEETKGIEKIVLQSFHLRAGAATG